MKIASRIAWIAAVLLVFALGITLRTVPYNAFHGVGFDETLYQQYTTQLLERGLGGYPSIVHDYMEYQKTLPGSILPPMRFLFIGTAALWSHLSGLEPIRALGQVASGFSILTLVLTFVFMGRAAGRGAALAVTALMACAPTQIHMGQHALVDGFFTFWALLVLWLLWENLQRPRNPLLLAAYGAGLALMVLTKENAAFVYVAVLAILVANRWLRFGTVSGPLLAVTVLGPAVGALGLLALAGGVDNLVGCYQLSVSKNFTLEHAIRTGDGPWHRYLVDLLLVSPWVLVLAIGAFFQLDRERHRPQLYLALFIVASYLLMCNIRYGMNLRYANMWDAPLRLLAYTELCLLAERFGLRRRNVWLAVAVTALCIYDLRQYRILAIDYNRLYELIPEILLRAQHIIK
ncbi:MAG: glycosyltransferase family 39 protein [Chthoniobacteraceae bacterium]|nr:glycosyltransferase family 39 protein [Chthoniobacteraceae bacterium]